MFGQWTCIRFLKFLCKSAVLGNDASPSQALSTLERAEYLLKSAGIRPTIMFRLSYIPREQFQLSFVRNLRVTI